MIAPRANDILCLFETAIDSLDNYEFQLFATYFDPPLVAHSGELLERTPERLEEARQLWARLGQALMDSLVREQEDT